MLDALNNLAHDKALHAIAGGLLAAVAAVVAIKAGYPQYAWQAALAVPLVAGIAKEGKDRLDNRKKPGSHDVSGADALATALGGVPVAAPLFVTWLIARGAF